MEIDDKVDVTDSDEVDVTGRERVKTIACDKLDVTGRKEVNVTACDEVDDSENEAKQQTSICSAI